jgi:hypothetical protein
MQVEQSSPPLLRATARPRIAVNTKPLPDLAAQSHLHSAHAPSYLCQEIEALFITVGPEAEQDRAGAAGGRQAEVRAGEPAQESGG